MPGSAAAAVAIAGPARAHRLAARVGQRRWARPNWLGLVAALRRRVRQGRKELLLTAVGEGASWHGAPVGWQPFFRVAPEARGPLEIAESGVFLVDSAS